MTGTQLLVLALLGLAFAGGWVARGATDDDDDPDTAGVLAAGREALDEAIAALHAVVAMLGVPGDTAAGLRGDAIRNLARSLAGLSERERAIAAALGDDHPCVADFRRAREALDLVGGAVAGGDSDRALVAAFQQAAADARRRYAIGAAAIEAIA